MTDREGVDIMFRRWEEAKEISRQEAAEALRAEGRAQGVAQGIKEGMAQGVAQGKTEGRAQGRAEGIIEGMAQGVAQGKTTGIAQGRAEAQRVWQAWYQRQVEAQAKGQPFTEPPPTLNGDTYEE